MSDALDNARAALDLDALEALAKAATPGPWEWSPGEDQWWDCGPNLETVERGPFYSDGSQGAQRRVVGSWGHDANGVSVGDADKAFIAAADPTTVLALVEELRRERERLTAPPAEDDREALSVHLAGWDSGEAFQTPEDAERDGQNMVWWRAVANSALVWFRRQGPVTEEWEYGVWHVDKYGLSSVREHKSREDAEKDYASCGMSCEPVRRQVTGPGPWEPFVSTEKNE